MTGLSQLIFPLMALLATSQATSASNISCNAATFSSLTLSNIQILDFNVTASPNFPIPESLNTTGIGEVPSTVDICQIAIKYTHPGQYDTVNAYIGLPLDASRWNSRFLMVGGGGWVAGGAINTLVPVAFGYTSSSTDGGHNETTSAAEWGLASEGNTNWPALNDFASVALDEAAKLGKLATEIYLSKKPIWSYWYGCSTGGRQGHMMAQRFPEHFDGILAGAPGINWQKFMTSLAYGAFMAEYLDVRPPTCVLDQFTSAAIAACDSLDGVEDGIISSPHLCDFNGSSLVGQVVNCTNPSGTITITDKMAELVNAIWEGPKTEDGKSLWYGFNKDTSFIGTLNTTCTTVDNCTVTPFSISDEWLGVFLARNSTWSTSNANLTPAGLARLHRISIDQYTSTIGTDNSDLTDFKARGAKMITWHGLADQLIPPLGIVDYYQRVLDSDADTPDYYRLFLAPGTEHCSGRGLDPSQNILSSLIEWVENGTAPETVVGQGQAVGSSNATRTVNLCAYPKVLTYTGTDPNSASSFSCI